ncbi:NYN domain-containing protein [Nocardioides terrigena]|uniref:NYN domain-containing protein n=1 Tax=Nocardioides terrigena TaxID=424797 RepID=UPI000D31B1AD|nr:NYN domain-containing protein [Nocardioides terrigena]
MAYGSRWFQHNAQNASKARDGRTGEPASRDGADEGGEVSLSELIHSSLRAAEAAQAAGAADAALAPRAEDVSQADVPMPRVSAETPVPAGDDPDAYPVHPTAVEEASVDEAEAPAKAKAEPDAEPEPEPDAEPRSLELSALVRQWMATRTDLRASGGPDGDVIQLPTAEERTGPESSDDAVDTAPDDPRAALPRRRKELPRSTPSRRMGVLIDAHTTLPESLDGLFDALVDEGTVSVSRAYGDWSPMGSQEWMPQLRHHAIQPVHHFPTEHDQRSMVAMTIDAVDLARDSAVDVLVLVGDLASGHPLLQRLNACGIPVLAFGPTDTPYDVRALCEEFVDLGFLDARESVGAGRHRA